VHLDSGHPLRPGEVGLPSGDEGVVAHGERL
jgi:hypothetical protein